MEANLEEAVKVVQVAELMPGETAEGMPVAAERMVVSVQVVVLTMNEVFLSLNISR